VLHDPHPVSIGEDEAKAIHSTWAVFPSMIDLEFILSVGAKVSVAASAAVSVGGVLAISTLALLAKGALMTRLTMKKVAVALGAAVLRGPRVWLNSYRPKDRAKVGAFIVP
jgi:hypothetical protein